MKFTVSIDVMAIQDVNDILSRYRSEQAEILGAFDDIVDELRVDANFKGTPVSGASPLRNYVSPPLKATYRIDGSRVKIRMIRYRE